MRRKKEWFDDESFWVDLYPIMFPETRIAAAEDDVANALRLTKPKGKAALDLCCGPGRCTVALAKRGYAVTGVDRTRFLLNKARNRARKAIVKIEWVEQDMRDFIRPDSFDLVLSMFTSFGFFKDKQEDMMVLRNVFDSLRAGGKFLIDVMGKEQIARIFAPSVSSVEPDGTRLIRCHEVLDDWTMTRNEWILIRNGRAKTYKFDLRVYSGQELRDRLENTGFTDVRLYGNLNGEPYGLKTDRLVAVATKPRNPRTKGK